MSHPETPERPEVTPEARTGANTGASSDSAAAADEILERNVAELLHRASTPPAMDAAARERVLAHLLRRVREAQPARDTQREAQAARDAQREAKAARRAPRWRWAGLGLCAAAAAALTLLAVRLGGDPDTGRALHNTGAAPERLSLADGTEILLHHDARVVVTGARSVRLESGDILLDVARGQAPFVVDAPHGRVVVLGTRFLVNARPDHTLAAVVRGRVRAENAAGQVVVRAGEQAELWPGKEPAVRRAPRLSSLTGWARAALARESRHVAPIRSGTLLARDPGQERYDYPLPVRDVTVDVHVDNQVARVAVDQTFFNAQPRQLEGVYRFPLPPDAAISRLAMYVDGQRMEAAVVERTRGRTIYESIVYRQRDPALLEQMAGNELKMRIFPLFAREERRIVLSYTQALPRLYDDVRLEVPLPALDAPADRVRFHVRLVGCAACEVRSPSHELALAPDGDDLIATLERTAYALGDDLVLLVRDPATGPRVAEILAPGGHYWMLRAQPALPAATSAAPRHARRWVILHDTSASRGPLEREAQRFVIGRLLRELDEDDEVSLLAFDATVRPWAQGFLRVGDVDAGAADAFLDLESQDGVGYTDLRAALEHALEQLDAAGGDLSPHILYVGDGVVTAGAGEEHSAPAALARMLAGRATFVAMAVGDTLDATMLRSLAAATGGMVASASLADDLAWRAFDLVAALATPRVTDVEVALLGEHGEPLAGAVAYASRFDLADGDEIEVVARLGEEQARAPVAVELRGRLAGAPFVQRVELQGTAHRAGAGYLPRLWAIRHVAALVARSAEEHRSEITRLGMEHFLLTPHTSLLVLETDAMYRQYKVARDRDPGWAAYELPDRIEVVREAVGESATAVVDPDTILVRSPVRLLHTPLAFPGAGSLFGTLGRGELIGGLGLGLGGLSGLGTGAGGGGTASRSGAIAATEPALDTGTAGAAAHDDAPAQILDKVVTTDELQAGLRSWQASSRVEARESTRAGESEWLGSRGFGRAGPTTRSSHWMGGRYLRGSYGDAPLPAPLALQHAGDARLDDLTVHVPGLFEDEDDGRARALRRSGQGRRGAITEEARALIARARAGQAGARYQGSDGQVLTVDARGRFSLARTLSTGLHETVIHDGTSLYHVYRELGLATRRRSDDIEALVHERWLPFLVPAAEALERWYHVRVVDGSTLRIAAGDDADAPHVDVVLDRALRVVEVRAGQGAHPRWRFEHGADALVMIEGSRRTEMAVSALTSEPDFQPDGRDLTTVDMPLRQPAHARERMDREAPGSEAWRRAGAELLASAAALGQRQVSWDTLRAIHEHAGAPRRGELTLASGGARHAPDRAALDAVLGRDPRGVAAYLAASHAAVKRPSVAPYVALAERAEEGAEKAPSLIAALALHRAALLAIQSERTAARAAARVRPLVERYPASPLAYIAAHQLGARWWWRGHEPVIAVWDALAESPWAGVAGVQAARLLFYRDRFEQAAERYEALLAQHDALRPDGSMHRAFLNSSRGLVGWRQLWSGWRDRVLESRDPARMAELVYAALQTGAHEDLPRVSARAVQLEVHDPQQALILADALMAAGLDAAANTVLAPWIAADAARLAHVDAESAAAMLTRAAQLATRQGRYADAARLLERAMARGAATDLHGLRAEFRQLVDLYGKLAQAHAGAERDAALAGALAAATRWRGLDPGNTEIDTLAARLLYAVDRPGEAWRHLSTIIERQPMEGSAYQRVAEVLEGQGRVAEAEPLWKRAFAVDPTNPTWLLRRAQALTALGHHDEARALLQEIAGQSWHERFAGVVSQARQQARQAHGR